MTPPSLLLLAGEYPPQPGGVGDYTALLAAALAAQGVQVTVLATRCAPASPVTRPGPRGRGGEPTAPPHAAREGRAAASTVDHRRGEPEPRGAVRVWRLVRRWDWRCAGVVCAAVRAARADIVHVQYQPAAFGLHGAVCWLPRWLARRHPELSTVATFHDLRMPYLWPKAGGLRASARDLLLCGVDAAVFTDPTDWSAARRLRPAGRHWIPIGSNLAPTPPRDYDRQAWRARLGATPETLLVVHLGFLNRTKGLETLFAALTRLRAAGRDARLVLVGAEAGGSDAANRAYAAEVAGLLRASHLAEAVVRLPVLPAEAASAHLLAADVAAFPFADGASLRRGSLLAALAHGLPTVTTWPPGAGARRTPAGAALLREGENVVRVPPDDPAALAEALVRVAADPALRARLAAGGTRLVRALSWERIAAAHRALYETLRAASPRTGARG